jgi:hypothetical protein
LIDGDGEYSLAMASVNAGYDFSDGLQFYSFGTYGHRFGKTWQNVRLQNQVIAAPGSDQACSATDLQGYNTAQTASGTPACAIGVSNGSGAGVAVLTGSAAGTPGVKSNGQIISSGQAGTLFTPGELVMYPQDMEPQEALYEDDYRYNFGEKFTVIGWSVDADIGYGKDIDKVWTLNSGNRSLFIDTHTSPANFYDGSFTASQFNGTIDATHSYNVGMASPLTVAVGIEAREATALPPVTPLHITRRVPNPFPASPRRPRAITAAKIMPAMSILHWRRLRRCSSTSRVASSTTQTSAIPRSARSQRATTSTHNGPSAVRSRPASARLLWRKSSILP